MSYCHIQDDGGDIKKVSYALHGAEDPSNILTRILNHNYEVCTFIYTN